MNERSKDSLHKGRSPLSGTRCDAGSPPCNPQNAVVLQITPVYLVFCYLWMLFVISSSLTEAKQQQYIDRETLNLRDVSKEVVFSNTVGQTVFAASCFHLLCHASRWAGAPPCEGEVLKIKNKKWGLGF